MKKINDDIGQDKTETWIKKTNLRVITIDGSKPIDENIRKIQDELEFLREER